jgi:uncharacterized protein YbjT (DUF2867 family)
VSVCIVVGGTGLVGSAVVKRLYQEGTQFVSLTRRPQFNIANANKVIDFENDRELQTHLVGDTLFYCFGTTLKTAGSRENFLKIEWSIGQRILRLSKEAGIKNLILVSSQGASAKSSILYSRVKGMLEDFAKSLNFESIAILRPSLLLGERSEDRFFEGLAQRILGPVSKYMKGPLLLFRPIKGELVAERMIELSRAPLSGCHIYENDLLHVGFKAK